jgi:VanZ family protein
MRKLKDIGSAWGLALLMMLAIFVFSAQPVTELPNFGFFDTVVKKGGHVLGYALLAVFYWRGLRWERERAWQAWLLAVLYAITDEFHQKFVAGRHPSALDVFLFDATGAAIGLWVRQRLLAR